MKPFYVGSYKQDAKDPAHNGWLVGTFMEEAPRKNAEVEIKYWEFSKGNNEGHPAKTSAIIECVFILKGSVRAMIDGDLFVLNEGDYVVIQPGTPSNAVYEVLEDCAGITIKAPSDPAAKQVIPDKI